MNGRLLLNVALCLHRSVDPVKMFCQIPMVLWSVWFRLHVLTIANVLHYFTHVSGLQRGVRQKLSFVRLIDLSSWGSLRIGIVLECIGEHVEIHIGRACSSINRFNLISFVQWFNLIPFVYYVDLILFVHYVNLIKFVQHIMPVYRSYTFSFYYRQSKESLFSLPHTVQIFIRVSRISIH